MPILVGTVGLYHFSHAVRPSGHPTQILHVVLDCPTLTRGTYTSLDYPVLDPQNNSMNALLEKGFNDRNCFAFDSFPRRVKFGTKERAVANNSRTWQKKVPREIWPEFKSSHDELHKEYRKHGGEVTLLMGDNAYNAWRDVVRTERVDVVELKHYEAFSIWAEIPRTVIVPRKETRRVSDDVGFCETDQSGCDQSLSSGFLYFVSTEDVECYSYDGQWM
jgi:hypothetical protein